MNLPLSSWQKRDQQVVWHPFSPLNPRGAFRPLNVSSAEGSYYFLENGKKLFDGISSWWVNLHGHGHPYLQEILHQQFGKLDHVLFAGFTHEGAVVFAERLLSKLDPSYEKVFYSDNGSTAIEVALKMAIQRENLRGLKSKKGKTRRKLLAFQGAYHGDTFGAMALGERGLFTQHFAPYLFEVTFIAPPIPGHEEQSWQEFSKLMEDDDVSVFIFEPLLQGSAGMVTHDGTVLERMLKVCQQQSITTIADEVMTGFYRTGTFRATEQLNFCPDLLCFSKGITGGVFPLGVTVCHEALVEEFRPDSSNHLFFHGHSYTANPLALSMANGSLDLLESPETLQRIKRIEEDQKRGMKRLQNFLSVHSLTEKVVVRQLGTMLAFEIVEKQKTYLHSLREELYGFFLEGNVLLRPLGNIAYTLPPYCATTEELTGIHELMMEFLKEHFSRLLVRE